MKPIREINQSTIKQVLGGDFCPSKYKAYDIDKLYSRTSESMVRGQYFEWISLGTRNREGEIPELPLLKNGKKSTAQLRIEEQAEKFWQVMAQEGVKIISTDQTLRCWLTLSDGRTIVVHGTLDIIGVKNGKLTIIDLKLTGDVTSKFGPFCWGDPDKIDQLQAHLYKYLMKQLTGQQYDFEYAVFDYKPKPEHKIIPVVTSLSDVQDMNIRIEHAVRMLEEVEAAGYPARPNMEGCKRCKVEDCASRMSMDAIIEAEAEAAPSPAVGKTSDEQFEEHLNKLLDF